MRKQVLLPIYQDKVSCGFPSSNEGDIEEMLDINDLLVKHPAATFFLKVSGDSMIGVGICDGDILVVDRSIKPIHRKIVIASLNGELTVKRWVVEGKKQKLVPENHNYPEIEITCDVEFKIFGVVTGVVRLL